MPEIDITVAGRSYRVACGPGEEAHLNAAARLIDIEADAIRKAGATIPESRMMLMAALIIADRLNGAEARLRSAEEALRDREKALGSAETQLRAAREQAAAAPARSKLQPNLFADDLAEEAVALLEETAERLERLAGRVSPAG